MTTSRSSNLMLYATLCVAFIISSLPRHAVQAKETREIKEREESKTHDSLTVAILEFNANNASNKDIGSQISEILAATLSGLNGVTLVDRSTLSRTLQEHELNLTGVVNTDQAIQIGKLVGAKILITGKAFVQGPDLYITAKLVGTETSKMEGIYVKADKDADVGGPLMKLSEKIASCLREAGPKLINQEDRIPDPLPGLKKSLAGRTLPKIAIHITEQHISAAPAAQFDSSVNTDLARILTDAGFTVIDGNEKEEIESGVGIIISGQALSEFAARIGSLVSCSARVEIKMTDRKSKEILMSASKSARAVDLSEILAGKTALQKASQVSGIEILRRLDAILPALRESASKPAKH